MAQRGNHGHRRLLRFCSGWLLTLSVGCGGGSESPPAHPPASRAEPAPLEQHLETMPPLNVLQRLRGGEEERRGCFAASGGDREGFVKLAWRVTPEGRARDIVVEGSSVHHEGIEKCLADAVAQLDFGPRQQPAEARWTFIHRLPKMPGTAAAPKKKRAKKRSKHSDDEQEIAGVSIEKSSPGSLDLERIEDIVHAGFPLFAYCYRAGLERDPSLSGVVRLRFVIDEEGAVMGVMDSGSEFADMGALDCMAEGIFALNFPAPSGGDVRVQYRIVFESG